MVTLFCDFEKNTTNHHEFNDYSTLFNKVNCIMKKALLLLLCFICAGSILAQRHYVRQNSEDSVLTYNCGKSYPVKTYTQKFKAKKPKNIILMIGDGMGTTQVYAGLTANRGVLFLDNFKQIGFSKTYSASSYITDSGAGGTALATGSKSYNKAIGVNTDTVAVENIVELAQKCGKATGVVVTDAIVGATPGAFLAHQPNRYMYEEIASDIVNSSVDVLIGGGYKFFTQRKDGHNLISDLVNCGYQVLQDMNAIAKVKAGRLAGLTAFDGTGRVAERGDMLPVATETAIHILSQQDKGFFLMVEGSQIDWGSEDNNTVYTVEEMLDFDQTIGKALDFASKDGETLIVVTADHESGGFAINGGNMSTGRVEGAFTRLEHTAVMVPIFAYGPGAENFIGIMENTEIAKKIKKLLAN